MPLIQPSTALLGCVVLLCTAGASRGALIAYEGFDYPAGTTVSGQAGGVGWTNAWSGGSAGFFLGTNTVGNLSYTDANGLSLQTGGGSLLVGNPLGTTATTATPSRVLNYNLSGGPGTTAGPGATTWISFLYKRLNFALGTLPYLRQANFAFFEGSGERVSVGGPNTSATVSNVLSLWGNGATHSVTAPLQAADFPINPGSVYFVLVKVVSDGTAAADSAYVWFNWTNLLVEPSISTATLVDNELNLSSVNTLRFQAGNQNTSGSNAVFQVDELRVGTTFADVTPQSGVPVAPAIIFQPADQVATLGTTATLSVTATGTAPLYYQWFFNTNIPAGPGTNRLVISTVTTNDAGVYFVVVTNSVGALTSQVAVLTVVPPVPAGIAAQPQSRTALIGDPVTFAVTATGTAPFFYQWYFNTNTPLPQQTNSLLTFAAAQTNDSGGYSVLVSNYYGAVTSSVATLSVIPRFERLPAFPGADGAARYASGGRGGLVYHVTRLDRNYSDAAPGTLRYGLTDANFPAGVPRTIVFDVAGVFWLGRYGAERPAYDNGWDTQSRFNVGNNITVAGQTAPGPVIIMGGVTKPGGQNIVIRNVTFAPGYGMKTFNEPDAIPAITPMPGDFPDSCVYDALDVSGQDVLLDHLTAIYATDETISCNELAANLTIQYCDIAQGQNYPQADAESPGVYTGHALGSLLQAGSNARISIINNLYAHLKGRLPRVGSEVGTGAYNDFRNNVFYNWYGTAGSGASGQPSFNNFINNFYLAGPGGDDVSGTNITTGNAGGSGIFNGASALATRAYVAGNLKDINKNGSPTDASSADASFSSITAQPYAYEVNIGVTSSAMAAFTNVLHYAGARWWVRGYDFVAGNADPISTNDIAAYVDQRIIHETATGTGRIVAWADDPLNPSAAEGTEWRSLLALRADPVTCAAPFNRPPNWDSDGDGMPDQWEIEHGLDPNVPNPNDDFDRDGYTDLEEYLNELAAWPAPGPVAFNTNTNNRYAEIFNWSVTGATVSIGGTNTVSTSRWQPSRFDTAVVSNCFCVVDAVGQHAGRLSISGTGTLQITNGWLSVADTCQIETAAELEVQTGGTLRITNNLVSRGTLRLTGSAALWVGGSFTNLGVLDLISWRGRLPQNFVNRGFVLDGSSIVIINPTLNGADFQATITAYSGHNYQLQYTDTLSGTWQAASAAVPGTGGTLTLIHPGGRVGEQRFYRVLVNP